MSAATINDNAKTIKALFSTIRLPQAWQIEIVSKVFKTTNQNNPVRLTHIKYLRHSHKNFYWQEVLQLVLQCISQSCASLLRMIEI